MKEAIGGVSIFQLAVIFLLIFTAIMCLTINHSKAFGVKDEIINIIEANKYASLASSGELDSAAIEEIVDYLTDSGYRITGQCPSGDWTGYTRNYGIDNNNAAFCVRSNDVSQAYYNDLLDKCSNGRCTATTGDLPNMHYYEIALFYQLDIPVIGQILNFRLYGSTRVLYS